MPLPLMLPHHSSKCHIVSQQGFGWIMSRRENIQNMQNGTDRTRGFANDSWVNDTVVSVVLNHVIVSVKDVSCCNTETLVYYNIASCCLPTFGDNQVVRWNEVRFNIRRPKLILQCIVFLHVSH